MSAGQGANTELLKHFLTIRKSSYKYAPAFQRLHGLVNGGGGGRPSLAQLRQAHGGRAQARVVLGEKSDLGLCQLADSTADKLRLAGKGGVTVLPAKSPSVYYGHLAAHRERYSVPQELKYTESVYSSRAVFVCLWTDLQMEAPDLFTQLAVGNNELTNLVGFGHLHNPRTKIRSVGGMPEFTAWLQGRATIFPKNLDLEGANVYVFFSDNFLEMFPTNYRHIFASIKGLLGGSNFVRFAYVSRHPVSYSALQAYPFPPVSQLLAQRIPHRTYNVNVMCNVQRQEYSENLSASKFAVRTMAHSTLIRADQPMNELILAQKSPAEDNANLAFLDKFGDYKTATNAIFVTDFNPKGLQPMHPHMLLLYTLALLKWPETLAKVLSLCPNLELSDSQRTALFKKTHTELIAQLMLKFDGDAERTSIIRSLALGRPELVEDLRAQLLEYTTIPGTAFNTNKAKALAGWLVGHKDLAPEGEYYEFQAAAGEAASGKPGPTLSMARQPQATDSIWAIDCEFVRHAISLRGHINEVNKKLRFSWCKAAPEAS